MGTVNEMSVKSGSNIKLLSCILKKKFFLAEVKPQNAKRTQEAFETLSSSQVMDAGQTWRCFHHKTQLRTPQARGVSSHCTFLEKPFEVRPHHEGGGDHLQAASDQD